MTQPSAVRIQSIADPEWFDDGTNDCLYIEAYEMALAPPLFKGNIFKFNQIFVIVGAVQMEYLEIGAINVKFGEGRQLSVAADHRTSTSELSPKVITLQPHSRARSDSERELADRSSEYVSLLVATNYRNIAFRRIFSNFLGYRDNSLNASTPALRLPFDLPRPDLSPSAWQRFYTAEKVWVSIPEDMRRKVTLSLHWHLKGLQTDGVDSLLSSWVAIETLAMKSTNVAEINTKLVEIYRISKEEASVEFGVGKIFGLRSAIVHNGQRKAVSTHLTDYLENLYSDLLMHELTLPTMHRARSYLASNKLSINALIA